MSTVSFFKLENRPEALAYQREHFNQNTIRRLRQDPTSWRDLPECSVPAEFELFWEKVEEEAGFLKNSVAGHAQWLDQVLLAAWKRFEANDEEQGDEAQVSKSKWHWKR